jgi:hypothetical protein
MQCVMNAYGSCLQTAPGRAITAQVSIRLHLKEFQASQFRALVIVIYRRKIDDLGVNE